MCEDSATSLGRAAQLWPSVSLTYKSALVVGSNRVQHVASGAAEFLDHDELNQISSKLE